MMQLQASPLKQSSSTKATADETTDKAVKPPAAALEPLKPRALPAKLEALQPISKPGGLAPLAPLDPLREKKALEPLKPLG
jgi:hypothetical protein